jgi:hypothetical protein
MIITGNMIFEDNSLSFPHFPRYITLLNTFNGFLDSR